MKIDFEEFVYTGRGSTGLWAILKNLNKENSKILVPVNICEIVIPIIYKAGMIPIFYDVNETDGNGILSTIKDCYTGDETVLLAVHNFGIPLEIEAISNWAKANNIFFIEDVCNAIGATYKNIFLGWWGDASIFSFGYAKIIEYGVGGALIIKDDYLKKEVLKTLATLEEYSDLHKNKDIEFQTKIRECRLNPDLQAPSVYIPLYNEYANYLLYNISNQSINEIKSEINKLNVNLTHRAVNASHYRTGITSGKVLHIEEKEGQVYWRYNLLVDAGIRQDLIEELRKNKILVSTWYPPIINLFEKEYNPLDFSGSISFGKRIINLFVDLRVSDIDISKTIKIVNNF